MTRFFQIELRAVLITALVLLTLCDPTACQDSNWVKHDDPLGFSINHPPDWIVKVNTSEGYIQVASPDDNIGVSIQPFIQEPGLNASDYVNLSAFALKGDIYPGSSRQLKSEIPGLDEFAALITFKSGATSAEAAILCSIYQRSGMIFLLIGSPEDQFEAHKEMLIQMLQTLTFTPPAEGDIGIKYVPWTEPSNAFSISVPEDWYVTGGIERYPSGKIGLYEGPRAILEAISPDRDITINWGDEDVPTFQTPTQVGQFFGFKEGQWTGERQQVMSYMSGAEFAEAYVANMLARERGYTNVVITQRKDLPERSRSINDNYESYGLPMYLDVGEVYFSCLKDGKILKGYYLAGTQFGDILTEPGAKIWTVPWLFGYTAPETQDSLASEVLAHMISSIQYDSEWIKNEIRNAENAAEALAKANKEISDIIMEPYQANIQSQENIYRKEENAILGETDLIDPETGETWKAEGGHNYYWGKGTTGNVGAATETYDRPDIDFRPLLEY